jgi:dimethylaniline monooxygenase (N-oxide forming)
VVFEALPYIGGQWQYTTPDPSTGEVMSSIYHGVILNSCRDSTAFSDFPMDPARYPDYFDHELYIKYLHEYAEFYRLKEHVRLNTRVQGCKQLDDGSWMVSYQEKGKEPVEERFNAIFACTGHMSVPEIPDFEGKDTFKGEFLHSHVYRTPGSFEGKRVVIIGIGSSAVDIASEIAPQAKELHLITRRGGWVLPRYILGKPVEAYDSKPSFAPRHQMSMADNGFPNFRQSGTDSCSRVDKHLGTNETSEFL